jgi:NADPH2:quinone reductase
MSGDAFEAELRSLAPFGRIVVFGNAGRTDNKVSPTALLQHSTAVIGFWLVHFVLSRREQTAEMIGELLGAVASGELEVVIGNVYPMSEVAKAHEDIAARRTTGKLLLDPSA